MSRSTAKARKPAKSPTTPEEREAAFRAELRRVAKGAPPKVRRWFLALAARGEYGEGPVPARGE